MKKANLLKQDFNVCFPNSVWVGDITYNWTNEGWLYTAIVKDLCTKEIVGYAMSDRITKELAIKAMKMAYHETVSILNCLHRKAQIIFCISPIQDGTVFNYFSYLGIVPFTSLQFRLLLEGKLHKTYSILLSEAKLFEFL